ncbi:MAG: hypothetical protein J7K54_04385 [Candidatus Aenigmarchaeota archaeon]|nr:hypothetical protein [Candidatus Aenigmarchaeota archaeon]
MSRVREIISDETAKKLGWTQQDIIDLAAGYRGRRHSRRRDKRKDSGHTV